MIVVLSKFFDENLFFACVSFKQIRWRKIIRNCFTMNTYQISHNNCLRSFFLYVFHDFTSCTRLYRSTDIFFLGKTKKIINFSCRKWWFFYAMTFKLVSLHVKQHNRYWGKNLMCVSFTHTGSTTNDSTRWHYTSGNQFIEFLWNRCRHVTYYIYFEVKRDSIEFWIFKIEDKKKEWTWFCSDITTFLLNTIFERNVFSCSAFTVFFSFFGYVAHTF